MAHKLAIAAIVTFPVTLKILDEGRTRSFGFELMAARMPQDELRDEVNDHPNRPVEEVLRRYVNGWRHQQLVLDDATGQPAEFSAEAFDTMLSVMNAPGVIFGAYVEACGAKGRTKN